MKSTNASDYIHRETESFMSRALKLAMRLSGIKLALEKSLQKGNIRNDAAPIPGSISKKYNVEVEEEDGFRVWTLSPRSKASEVAMLYFHGGAYVFNIYKQHWQLFDKLMEATNATIVVHDYPLVPKYTCKDALEFSDKVYQRFCRKHSSKKTLFVGDSAGAGLALSYAQYLRNEGRKLPDHIILSAPWLDVTLSNPDVATLDKVDAMLGIEGLQKAGKAYAGKLETTDYRVSPLYGDFKGLPQLSVFIGTHDLFWADVKLLKARLEKENTSLNYFEYPRMFHNWWIFVGLPESKSVLKQVTALLKH